MAVSMQSDAFSLGETTGAVELWGPEPCRKGCKTLAEIQG